MRLATIIGAILILIGTLYLWVWQGAIVDASKLAIASAGEMPEDWNGLKNQYPRLAIALKATGHADGFFAPSDGSQQDSMTIMQDVYRCASFNGAAGAGTAVFGLGFICGAACLHYKRRKILTQALHGHHADASASVP